jgi:phosphotransferase system  glucose/maltose/N-acetylglucosamine-specific IIC component
MTFEKETIRKLYKKLLAFYPRAFREQFGESMRQTFNDLCNERQTQAKPISFGFLLGMFVETSFGIVKERFFQIKNGVTMEDIISKPRSASIIGLILALPLAILFLILLSDIEPLNNYLKTLTTNADGYGLNAFGKVFFIFLLLLLPVGFGISVAPIVRNARSGHGFMTTPFNFLISALLFLFIARLVVGFIIDQYPCWIGVPNCD